MANKRQSTKRARQEIRRNEVNARVKTITRSAIKKAVDAIQKKDIAVIKAAYKDAVKALSKAASKGTIPKNRASRKIGRLTQLMNKLSPNA